MKTIEVNCFEVTQPDGGGMYSEHVCFASSETVAKAIVKHLGTGWPRTIEKYRKVFTIVESVDEYLGNTKSAVRARAASKLSVKEREVLGLDEKGNHVL